MHHKEMMPQFVRPKNNLINWKNLTLGTILFSLGLFKKVFIADTLSTSVALGYANISQLTFIDAWATTLAYTFQLYYDFSGYTDMALGAALMLNIKLPWNFNSPYKSVNIQDFWKRWHMTLSRWLRDYVYIPLGGNRKGDARTYIHLVITFLLGGLWHGAGWPFIIWGALHGIATAVHKAWQLLGIKVPKICGWFLTFMFVHLALVFFRSESVSDAFTMLQVMSGINGVVVPYGVFLTIPEIFNWASIGDEGWQLLVVKEKLSITLVVFSLTAFFMPNSMEIIKNESVFMSKRTLLKAIFLGVFMAFSATFMLLSSGSEFLYFNF